MCVRVLALDFIRKIQVNLVLSSTMVKKYLSPFKEAVEQGPKISVWIRSKALDACEKLSGKGSLFCLALWQTSQQSFILYCIQGCCCFMTTSLWLERCPNRTCQILFLFTSLQINAMLFSSWPKPVLSTYKCWPLGKRTKSQL